MDDCKIIPDTFRGIGFDTECWPDKTEETIFFHHGDRRMKAVSAEAVEEFIAYWENQIQVAREYVANGFNPNTHEWKKT